jgi:hypothetical protein
MIPNLSSVVLSGALGGVCAAFISNTDRDIETGQQLSSDERTRNFLSRTLLATISAVAAHALAYYVGVPLAEGAVALGLTIYVFSHSDFPEASLSHRTTAKVFAVGCGTMFSFFRWGMPRSPAMEMFFWLKNRTFSLRSAIA